MKNATRYVGITCFAVATSISLSGCKSGFSVPIWNPFAKPSPSSGLVQKSDGSFEQPNMPKSASTDSSWSTPFKKMGDTISSPFSGKSSDPKPTAKQGATDSISLAAKENPPSAGLYVSLAKLQERSGNTSAAVEEYNKALDLEPRNLGALLGLARLYDRQGRFDEALRLYRTAGDAHPGNASVQNDLGLCLARSGKLNDAAAALQKAISLDPEKDLYRNNLATVLVELGKNDAAYQALVPAHGEAVAHYNLGYLLLKRDQKEEALQHFQAAAKLNPNFSEARQYVGVLQGKGVVAAPQTTIADATTGSNPLSQPISTPLPGVSSETRVLAVPVIPAAPAAAPAATNPVTPSTPAAPLPADVELIGPRLSNRGTNATPTTGERYPLSTPSATVAERPTDRTPPAASRPATTSPTTPRYPPSRY